MGNSASAPARVSERLTSDEIVQWFQMSDKCDYYLEIEGIFDPAVPPRLDIRGTRLESIPDPYRYIISKMLATTLVATPHFTIYSQLGRIYIHSDQPIPQTNLNLSRIELGVLYEHDRPWATELTEIAQAANHSWFYARVSSPLGPTNIICTNNRSIQVIR